MRPADELSILLTATAVGDRAAFRRLYDATAPKLLGILLRIVRDRAVAEEILQDVYLRVWNSAASFDPDLGSASAWLATIARHRAIDSLRQRPREVSAGKEPANWLESFPDPLDEEGQTMDRAVLRHCLERLEPDQRDCIMLAYVEGLSRDELAKRYGRPVNTIKTWLHRSLAVLRSCLETL